MDIKDMRAATAEAQAKELTELLRQQFTLRMQNSTGQLGNVAQLRKVRREIARLKTVMAEKSRTETKKV